MSLVKSPVMTEKKLAAQRANATRSKGPTTPEGLERIRRSALRHGYYSESEEAVFRILGEDPGGFEKLLEGLYEEWKPQGVLQRTLVESLARAFWRADRAERIQEGHVLRQAKAAHQSRSERLQAEMLRLRTLADRINSLASQVARPHYITSFQDRWEIEKLDEEGEAKELTGAAGELFDKLQDPRVDENAYEAYCEARLQAAPGKNRSGKAIRRGGAPTGKPLKLSDQEWAVREERRELLEWLLLTKIEICESERDALQEKLEAGPNGDERAAEINPAEPDLMATFRMEEFSFLQVWRITNLLLKLQQDQGAKEGAGGRPSSGRVGEPPLHGPDQCPSGEPRALPFVPAIPEGTKKIVDESHDIDENAAEAKPQVGESRDLIENGSPGLMPSAAGPGDEAPAGQR